MIYHKQRRTRQGLITSRVAVALATCCSIWFTAPAWGPPSENPTDVRTVREPRFFDLSLSPDSAAGAQWVSQSGNAIDAELEDGSDSSLLVLRINGGPPTFDQASLGDSRVHSEGDDRERAAAEYETIVAGQLAELIDVIHERHQGIGVSVQGLPVEPGRYSSHQAAAINQRFASVIERLDAFVPSKGIILDGAGISEGDSLQESHPVSSQLRGARPIVFRSNGVWRLAKAERDADLGEIDVERRSQPLVRDDRPIELEETRPAQSDRAWRSDEEVLAGGDIGLNLSSFIRARDYYDLHRGRTDRLDEGYLYPGNGWNGPTHQPDAVGDPNEPGYDAKVIARWDVIPYQTFHAQFEIGVVAFHLSGIERVDFAVEGGEWVSVTDMRLNPRTRVWEYFTMLRASDFEDGPIEVRAVVYPYHGIPRVLAGAITPESVQLGEHSIILSSNRGGTLPAFEVWVAETGNDESGTGTRERPFATLMRATRALADLNIAAGHEDNADGGVINLMEGEYNYGDYSWPLRTTTDKRWLTIRRAPDAQRNQVRLTNNEGGLNTHLVHLEEVTIDGIELTTGVNAMGGAPTLWLDKCLLTGREHGHDILFARHTTWNGGVYASDCEFTRVRKAVTSFALTRNCEIYDITADAFKNPYLVINCRISDIDATGFIEHPDIMQFFGNFENIIVYGLVAIDDIDAQGMFVRRDATDPGRFTNGAFVNYLVNTDRYSQWTHEGEHILFWQFQIVGQDMMVRDDGDIPNRPARLDLSSVRNSVFNELKYQSQGTPLSAIDIRNNHFIEGAPLGDEATTGNPRFWDVARHDFRPRPGSPLLDRVLLLLLPADVANHPLEEPAAVGAVQPAEADLVGAMFD